MAEPVVTTEVPPTPRHTVGFGRAVFLTFLVGVGMGLLVWTVIKMWQPIRAQEDDVAGEARKFLRKHKPAALSGSLQKLLANPHLVKTQDHPLLAQPAPDFSLSDPDGKVLSLKDLLKDGPVVVVFYYGYYCNHCVSQLFDINEDLPFFRELGGRVVAISADPPEQTRERFKKFGAFGFPVLSDPGNKVAEAYRVFRPAGGGKPEVLLHGTFLVQRDGKVEWAHVGDEPFTGNQTLLYHLARLEGRLPATETKP